MATGKKTDHRYSFFFSSSFVVCLFDPIPFRLFHPFGVSLVWPSPAVALSKIMTNLPIKNGHIEEKILGVHTFEDLMELVSFFLPYSELSLLINIFQASQLTNRPKKKKKEIVYAACLAARRPPLTRYLPKFCYHIITAIAVGLGLSSVLRVIWPLTTCTTVAVYCIAHLLHPVPVKRQTGTVWYGAHPPAPKGIPARKPPDMEPLVGPARAPRPKYSFFVQLPIWTKNELVHVNHFLRKVIFYW